MKEKSLWLLDFGGHYTITEGSKKQIKEYMNAKITAEQEVDPQLYYGGELHEEHDRLWAVIQIATSQEDDPCINFCAIPLSAIDHRTLEELHKKIVR